MKGGHPVSKEVVWLFFLVLWKAGTQDMWMSVLKMERLDFFYLSNFSIYEKQLMAVVHLEELSCDGGMLIQDLEKLL